MSGGDSGSDLLDDLRSMAATGQLLVVVGAGVSVGATGGAPTASWTGVLHHGVARGEQVGQGRLPAGWAGLVHPLIDSGDLEMMLSAAELITAALGGRSGGEYRRWLRESVGQLHADDVSVLQVLAALGMPLATTNYDGLLEEVTGLPAVSWRNGARVQRVLRGEEPGILHLHGFWDDPESVVLGVRSYESVLGDATAQALQHAMASLLSLLFVGFGAGLGDPNFGALRSWLARTFRGSEYRHFRICLDTELPEVTAQHDPDERIMVLPYGPTHADLAPFLRGLRVEASDASQQSDTEPPRSSALLAGLPPTPLCVGRDIEREDLVAAMLADPPRPVPVLGGPGIGKTTLTLSALHDRRVVERFGERCWFVRCDGATGAATMLTGIANELIPTDSSGGPLLPRLIAVLKAGPAVLILDNLETPWAADVLDVEQLLAQLGGVPGLVLVVTVRGTARPKGLVWRDVDPLTPLTLADARAVFLVIAGQSFEADAELDGLLEAVDRLPLAVELLAYNAQGEPNLTGLRHRWDQERVALLQRPGGNQRELNLAVSLELSISNPLMTDDARRLLSLLGMLPDGIAQQDLDHLLPDVGWRGANRLRQLALVFDDETGRLRCLAPVREHVATEHPCPDRDRDRAAAHYNNLIAQTGQLLGRPGGAAAAARIAAEAGNIATALQIAAENDDVDRLVPAIGGLFEYLRFTGAQPPSVLTELLRSLTLTDEWQQAGLLFDQALLARTRSNLDTARTLFERAVELYQQVGGVVGEANSILSLGDVAYEQSDYDTARTHYEQALQLYQQIGGVLGEANSTRGLGDVAYDQFDYDTARTHYEQALQLYQQIGSVLGEANIIQRLANIAGVKSDYDTARTHYEQALQVYRQVGSVLGEANSIDRLGDIAREQSDYDTARTHYEQALQLYQQVGSVQGEANSTRGLGDVAREQSDYDTARTHYERALALYQLIPEPYSIGIAHRNLAGLADSASERREHVDAAQRVWNSIGRGDLCAELVAEFGGND
jgi:tetratricopeptide (TPR) repeat protein